MILFPPDVITLGDWTRCAPWIEAALAHGHGTHDLADVYRDLGANRATLWPWDRSCLVSQIVDYPRFRCLVFWLAGGELDQLLEKEPGVIEWGRYHGCEKVAIYGRKGWQRVFAERGYRAANFPVFKEIAL